MPQLFADLACCAEWKITYERFLAQPPAHRALMREYLRAKDMMASVEHQEQREKRALMGS